MKKFSIILVILIIIGTIIAGVYYFNNNTNNSNSYESAKLSANNTISNSVTNTLENTNSGKNETNTAEIVVPAITEQELCSFSTKVSGTSGRKNNISICSSSINGTTIEAGETFSFWNIVGDTTSGKGYKKAKSFDEHGHTIRTYGGGVCQVSSTIYNAVLLCPELETIERHPHSKKVTYVEENKDAAVAYPSSNFKFKNNTDSKIRIDMNFDNKNLNVRIIKLHV